MTMAHTADVEETRQLGEALAELARAGDVILLVGDLGAGKTAFTQGFARGLGVTDPVTSPTFTLARSYEGRLRLNHLDVYRIENLHEAEDLGLGELIEDGVTVIEWGDSITPVLPADYAEVRLSYGDGDDDRDVTIRVVGPRWAARQVAISRVVAPWSVS